MSGIDTSPESVARVIARERHRQFPYSVEGLETASLLEALAAERDAALAREAKLREALQAKTIMDPNNSNSTWIDAQARAALQETKP